MTDTTVATAPETIEFGELLLLSLEQRFGRLVNAAETVAKFTAEGASNIERLTNHIVRLADALDNVSDTLGCITETVKGEDGVHRCFVRTHDASNQAFMLSHRDERDTGED
jgi:archaellum component FlaC